MQRRKLLIGVGSLAAGSAVLTETGAFTSVAADRTVSVNVAGDDAALLALAPYEGPNGNGQNGNGQNGYAKLNNGQLQVNLDGNANAKGGGSGVNDNAKTVVEQVFTITNQGTQGVGVYLEKLGKAPGAVTFQTNGDGTQLGEKSNDPSPGATVDLTPGETVTVDIIVDTRNTTKTDLLKSVTIYALASKFGGTNVGGGEEYSTTLTGESVALTDERALVGVPASGDDPGKAIVYKVPDATLNQNQTLEPTDGQRSQFGQDYRFGWNVAMDTDANGAPALLVVGAKGNSTAPTALYVYEYNQSNSEWVWQETIEGKGTEVAVDGKEEIIVSGKSAGTGASVFVFEKSNSWSTQPTIEYNKGTQGIISNPGFSQLVAVDGTTVLIGSGGNSLNSTAGSAYVIEKENGSWTQDLSSATELTTGDSQFGYAGEIGEDYLVVGGNGTGTTHIYERGSTAFQNQNPSSIDGGQGGTTIAIEGDSILVGSQGQGKATLYEPDGSGGWVNVETFGDDTSAFQSADSFGLNDDIALLGDAASDDTYLFER